MARHGKSLSADYFETMFRETDDPWDLETSTYEHEKFNDSILALSGRRYYAGFEIGCAKGVLTLKLAEHCGALLAVDVSETALAAARRRAAGMEQVAFERMAFPSATPAGQFDLVIFSEVAYYWDDDDLIRAARWVDEHLLPGGDVLLVHYTGETDYPQSGDEAVTKLSKHLTFGLEVAAFHRRSKYRLDLWRRIL